jgi:hypothetical protein
MKKLMSFLFFIFSFSALAQGDYLFNMYFKMNYDEKVYAYHFNFYQGTKGLIIKEKMNGVEKTHYIQSQDKQYIFARTPKDLIDEPLFYIYKIGDNKYKIQYPINMNDSNWDKFVFTVEDGVAYSEGGAHFSQLKVGKVVWDRYWGIKVPVGVESLSN